MFLEEQKKSSMYGNLENTFQGSASVGLKTLKCTFTQVRKHWLENLKPFLSKCWFANFKGKFANVSTCYNKIAAIRGYQKCLEQAIKFVIHCQVLFVLSLQEFLSGSFCTKCLFSILRAICFCFVFQFSLHKKFSVSSLFLFVQSISSAALWKACAEVF